MLLLVFFRTVCEPVNGFGSSFSFRIVEFGPGLVLHYGATAELSGLGFFVVVLIWEVWRVYGDTDEGIMKLHRDMFSLVQVQVEQLNCDFDQSRNVMSL